MMRHKLVATVLIMTLFVPEALLAQAGTRPVTTANTQPPAAATAPAQSSAQSRESVRPQPASRQRSFERETRGRRRLGGISKKEVVFMAAIAGTSMGIGALAAGAKGVAIGAIVGGWGAYAGHRLWNWVR